MPTIPRLTRPQVTSRPETPVTPRVDTTAADVLGVAAEAAGRFGAIVERERQRVDEILTNDAEVQFRGEIDGILMGEGGVLRQNGKNAIDASGKYQDQVRKAVARIDAGLTPRQRAVFQMRAAAASQDAERRVMAHVGNETERLDLDRYDALGKMLSNDAADAGREGDAGRANAAVGRTREETALFWDRQGAEPEVRAQKVAAAVSGARARQILAVAESGKAGTASDLLTEFGDELQEDDRKLVMSTVARLQQGQRATGEAGRILAEAKGDRAKQEEMIDALPLDDRADVRKVVKEENKADDDLAKDAQEAAFARLTAWVNRNPGRNPRLGAPADYDQLTLHQQNDLDRRSKPPKDESNNDVAAYLKLFFMAPADVAKMTPSEFSAIHSRLSPSFQTKAEGIWTRSKKDPAGVSDESAGILNANQRLERTYREVFGADPKKASGSENAPFAAYLTAVDSATRAITGQTKKPLGDTELQNIMTETALRQRRDAATEADKSGFFSNAADWWLQDRVTIRGGAPVPFNQIPRVLRDSITLAIQKRGPAFPATSGAVELAYAARLRGDFAEYDRLLGRPSATLAVPDITNPLWFVKKPAP